MFIQPCMLMDKFNLYEDNDLVDKELNDTQSRIFKLAIGLLREVMKSIISFNWKTIIRGKILSLTGHCL